MDNNTPPVTLASPSIRAPLTATVGGVTYTYKRVVDVQSNHRLFKPVYYAWFAGELEAVRLSIHSALRRSGSVTVSDTEVTAGNYALLIVLALFLQTVHDGDGAG